jgi:hypothetical protein
LKAPQKMETNGYISFNAEMAKAIKEDRKTQTRRAVTKQDIFKIEKGIVSYYLGSEITPNHCGVREFVFHHGKYQIGDILWVREPAKVVSVTGKTMGFKYLSDGQQSTIEIPSKYYKRHAGYLFEEYAQWIRLRQGVPNGCIKEMARTFVKITDVRVERLQDISEEDILKEGIVMDRIQSNDCLDYFNNRRFLLSKWKTLWNSVSKDGYKWDDNPYCFCYTFEVIK